MKTCPIARIRAIAFSRAEERSDPDRRWLKAEMLSVRELRVMDQEMNKPAYRRSWNRKWLTSPERHA